MSLQFTQSGKEIGTIYKIADRALALFGADNFSSAAEMKLHIRMDVSACHASGCPLRLDDLLAADDFNFMHDIAGIDRHLNRETGELEGFFRPRFARPDVEPYLAPYMDPTGERIDPSLLA